MTINPNLSITLILSPQNEFANTVRHTKNVCKFHQSDDQRDRQPPNQTENLFVFWREVREKFGSVSKISGNFSALKSFEFDYKMTTN